MSAPVAREIAREVGVDAMRALHRRSPVLDAFAFVGVWSTVIGLFVTLGTMRVGIAWVALFSLQGLALQCLGFLAHDLFVHRRVGGDRAAWWLANACLVPLLFGAAAYARSHADHHRHLGGEQDGEAYKEDLDRRWVKLLFLLGPGSLAVSARVFRHSRPAPCPPPAPSPEIAARLRLENILIAGFVLVVIVAAVIDPRLVLGGFVLPLSITLPIASTIRVVLEHGEMDRANPYHVATCYTAGPLTGGLFLWSVGDGHLIHHLFPGIPFYRLRRARRLMLPILLRHGVVRRTSLLRLLFGWFVENRRHATRWT